MDLYATLPNFNTDKYASLLRALDRARIPVKDLLILDALEVAKQANLPLLEVKRLTRDILDALHKDLGFGASGKAERDAGDLQAGNEGMSVAAETCGVPEVEFISSLSPALDSYLEGGIPTRYITEVTGESGCGKTQLLLQLLLSVQLPRPYGLSKNALYFSTENDLPTARLTQLLEENAMIASNGNEEQKPSLDNVLSVTALDLETQNHMLEYQVPIAISRYNIGLVVIDSITSNYRGELSYHNPSTLLERAWQLKRLGHLLQRLAAEENIAIVVANQISDQWTDAKDAADAEPASSFPASQPFPASGTSLGVPVPASSQIDRSSQFNGTPTKMSTVTSSPLDTKRGVLSQRSQNDQAEDISGARLDVPALQDLLSLDYQQPFFTGWGGPNMTTRRTPALGIVWTNQIACRIVLDKETVLVPDASGHYLSNRPGLGHTDNQGNEQNDLSTSLDPTPKDSSDKLHPKAEQTRLSASTGHVLQVDSAASATEPSAAFTQLSSFSDELWKTHTRRTLRVVFSPWARGGFSTLEERESHDSHPYQGLEDVSDLGQMGGISFEITKLGIQGIEDTSPMV